MFYNYDVTFLDVIEALLVIIVVITFFVIAYRLRIIMNIAQSFWDIEYKKPENSYLIKCGKCDKEVRAPREKTNSIICEHCNNLIELPEGH